MSNVSVWKNVQVAVQSALAASQAITDITKANPGVLTYGGTDTYANGDYVKTTVSGMWQMDARIARVANVNTTSNTFELEGIDTSAYDTFAASGSVVEEITFGTSLSVAVNVTASGGDFDFIDTTTIHDNIRKQIPGLASPSVFSFECIWDVADAGLLALKSASDAQAQRAIRFTFSNNQKFLFLGYIGCTLAPTGNAQDLVKTSVVITGYGRPTTYST